jgi:hypothetical protein
LATVRSEMMPVPYPAPVIFVGVGAAISCEVSGDAVSLGKHQIWVKPGRYREHSEVEFEDREKFAGNSYTLWRV